MALKRSLFTSSLLGLGGLGFLAIQAAGCSAGDGQEGSYEEAAQFSQGLSKCSGGTNGAVDYCSASCLCNAGEGYCDNTGECSAGLICKSSYGPRYGMPVGWDVCVTPACGNNTWDANECFVDCGGTSGCGTCSVTILSKPCGGTNGGNDYCRHPAVPCQHGEGNCSSSAQCAPGLTCKPGAGPQFGLPAGVDVCVNSACGNGVWDANECFVDCGGTSGCGTCSVVLLTKGCGGSNNGDDYCRNPNNPCAAGEGDCDSNAECTAGNACVIGNGPKFGLALGTDVCVPVSCTNGVTDAGEEAVDCGGTSQCGQCGAGSAFSWAKRFGDAAPQEGRGIAVDAAGNVYVIGVFQGTADFGGGVLTSTGANDVFVAKFDVAGTFQWAKQFGNANNQFGLAIALDASNNIVIGGFFAGTINFGGTDLVGTGGNDIWIAKLDNAGNHLWSKSFGEATEDQQGWNIAVDSSSNVYFTGYYRNTFNFGGAAMPNGVDWQAFLVKFDPNGVHQWSKGFGNTAAGQTFSRSVAVDAAANVYISGQFNATADFGGGALSSAGGLDAYIAKFDTNGNHVWSQRFGDAQNQQGRRVAVDSAGNVLFFGYIQGSTNFGCGAISSAGGFDTFLAKFTSAGACSFSNRYGDGADNYGESLATDTANRIIAGGEFEGTHNLGGGALPSAGGRDGFVAKFQPTGAHVWSRRFGDAGVQRTWAVAVEPNANQRVFATGAFAGTSNFGGGDLTSAGDVDIFVARFEP